MKRVLVVFGARPSAVKLAPVVHALEARGVAADVFLTGQHGEMLDCCLESLGIKPTYRLDPAVLGGILTRRLAQMTESVGAVLAREPYDAVIVVGDTVSGLAGALAGAYQDVPVAHVEAGLRTHGREPWPEEMTRKAIDAVAHWHFAPTLRARANLLRENVCHERIYLTGNTVVDSLKRLGVQRKRFSDRTVLVTLHRRENWDTMNLRAAVVRKLAEQHPAVWFIWPVHPNQIVFNAATTHCGGAANINLCDPMAYDEFLDCLASATLVITDSGGVQEEAAVLGVPTLVVRQNTERPEAIEAGVSRLLVDGNLFDSAHDLLSHPDQLEAMNRPSDCFGDGLAGERIADILLTGQTPLGEPCSA